MFPQRISNEKDKGDNIILYVYMSYNIIPREVYHFFYIYIYHRLAVSNRSKHVYNIMYICFTRDNIIWLKVPIEL